MKSLVIKQPSLFLSHGAPDLLLSDDPALAFFKQLGESNPLPKAIVIISAHWIAEPIQVTTGSDYETIHDFGGFAEALYQIKYPAKGDPELASEIVELLTRQGITAMGNPDRGLDHGVWVPLKVMYPEAQVPVIAVSLPTTLERCIILGKALGGLREQGIMVIGSGGSVHNLSALNRDNHTDAWAESFTDWLTSVVCSGDVSQLLASDRYTPEFKTAHPSVEHLAPLLVAAGAGSSQSGQLVHAGFTYGNIGMACYRFD